MVDLTLRAPLIGGAREGNDRINHLALWKR
jgi:hypothetical protein